MLCKVIFAFLLVGSAYGQWDPNFAQDRFGMVHLFEWHWGTIADECESLLAPYKIGGVQTSPPNENRVIDSRPWWERYQPISYILGTRSGDRNAFANMVDRCNAVGVRIYPDIVINHMCGNGGSGTGTAGSPFDANKNSPSFPAVPYGNTDFNFGNCYTSSGEIENYGDANQVRNCMLVGLLDLNQGKDYVRGKMIDYMNDLIDLGVAGFRVDACKHMWPADLSVIFGSLKDLRSDIFGSGKRAYFFQEVIDQGGEPITAGEYTPLGSVTEFKYGINLGNNMNTLQYLENFGEDWGMLPGGSALAFINNHDNQRGHGGGGNIVTFDDPYDLKILTAYMLAWPYGVQRVMSSYYFSNSDEGPPANQRSVNADGSCGNGWVCEHRWRPIRNMFPFATAVIGTSMGNWWTNDNNQIAFSREGKGFLAINKAGYDMSGNFATSLPDGSYCDVIHGDYSDGKCSGNCVTVSGGQVQNLFISGGDQDPMVALHVDAMATECNNPDGGNTGGGNTGGGGSTGGGDVCTDCSCTSKSDCGFMGIDATQCAQEGCLWCPNPSNSADPWCIVQQHGGSPDCAVDDYQKQDCGYMGINQSQCESEACCWAESNTSGTPWCYYPA